jgi:Pyruvate formate lyase-like
MAVVWEQRAHVTIDFDRLPSLGVSGMRRDIAVYQARLDPTRPDDLEKDAFWGAWLITLYALYRDYSVSLSPQMQDEVKLRTEHER